MTKNSNNQFRAVSFCLLSLLFFLTTFLSGCRKMPNETTNYITNYFYGDSLTDPNVPLRVVFTNPADGAVGPFNYNPVNEQPSQKITIQFNKLINTINIRPSDISLKIDTVSLSIQLSEGGVNLSLRNILIFQAIDCKYIAQKVYTVTLDTTIEDVHGYRLRKPYIFSFTPEPDFRVYTVSHSITDWIDPLNLVYIYINFNSQVDTRILRKLSITPEIQGKWILGTGNVLDSTYVSFQPDDTLEFDTKYTVFVAADAEDVDGHAIKEPFQYSFTTLPFEAKLSSCNGGLGSGGFELQNNFDFAFNAYVDTSTVRTAVTISPQVSFSLIFPWSYRPNYQSVTIRLEESQMQPETTYQITLGTTIRSKKSGYLKNPCIYKFTTGSIN